MTEWSETRPWLPLLTEVWDGLTGDAPAKASPEDLEVTGTPGHLASSLPVEAAGVAAVGSALLAAAELHRRGDGRGETVSVDGAQAGGAAGSERFSPGGGPRGGRGFAPFPRFWPPDAGGGRPPATSPGPGASLPAALAPPADATEADVAGAI